MKNLTFITGNPGKAKQLSKYLGVPVNHYKLDLTEIQSVDLEKVIKHKVAEAFRILNVPVLVDDVGLTINSLGKLPGPFVKFFIQEIGNQGICDLLKNNKDRSAYATVAIGYSDGGTPKIFTGVINGTISKVAIGDGGFGWDQIMIPEGYKETRSQMNEKDYLATDPRKLALAKFENFISKTDQK